MSNNCNLNDQNKTNKTYMTKIKPKNNLRKQKCNSTFFGISRSHISMIQKSKIISIEESCR